MEDEHTTVGDLLEQIETARLQRMVLDILAERIREEGGFNFENEVWGTYPAKVIRWVLAFLEDEAKRQDNEIRLLMGRQVEAED